MTSQVGPDAFLYVPHKKKKKYIYICILERKIFRIKFIKEEEHVLYAQNTVSINLKIF
jgi:hypothetical protein